MLYHIIDFYRLNATKTTGEASLRQLLFAFSFSWKKIIVAEIIGAAPVTPVRNDNAKKFLSVTVTSVFSFS